MFFYFFTTLFSFFLGLVLVFLYKNLFTLPDTNLNALQSSHTSPTPRFGGIAILISAATFSLFSPEGLKGELLLAIFPIFLIGLREDIGTHSSPKIRLLVASISAVLGIYFYDAWLSNIDTPGLDWILSYNIFGILFTVFAIVGLVNAINLIDGVNGLACGQVMISSLAIYFISSKVNDTGISSLALIIFFSTLGLFLVNFPFGIIFVGDAGAYTLGFLLAWMLVLLSHRHPEISDWALLAVIFWPVMETISAIFRRRINRTSPDKPDRLHFHQLIMRAWQAFSKGKISKRAANPLATVTIVPFASAPVLGGVVFCYNSGISAAIVILSSIAFSMSYLTLIFILRDRQSRRFIDQRLKSVYRALFL